MYLVELQTTVCVCLCIVWISHKSIWALHRTAACHWKSFERSLYLYIFYLICVLYWSQCCYYVYAFLCLAVFVFFLQLLIFFEHVELRNKFFVASFSQTRHKYVCAPNGKPLHRVASDSDRYYTQTHFGLVSFFTLIFLFASHASCFCLNMAKLTCSSVYYLFHCFRFSRVCLCFSVYGCVLCFCIKFFFLLSYFFYIFFFFSLDASFLFCCFVLFCFFFLLCV